MMLSVTNMSDEESGFMIESKDIISFTRSCRLSAHIILAVG